MRRNDRIYRLSYLLPTPAPIAMGAPELLSARSKMAAEVDVVNTADNDVFLV